MKIKMIAATALTIIILMIINVEYALSYDVHTIHDHHSSATAHDNFNCSIIFPLTCLGANPQPIGDGNGFVIGFNYNLSDISTSDYFTDWTFIGQAGFPLLITPNFPIDASGNSVIDDGHGAKLHLHCQWKINGSSFASYIPNHGPNPDGSYLLGPNLSPSDHHGKFYLRVNYTYLDITDPLTVIGEHDFTQTIIVQYKGVAI